MTAFQDQGEGELVPGLGFAAVRVLTKRRNIPTKITLRSGETFVVEKAEYARDIGADWEHIYFDADGQSYFLDTSEIATLTDSVSGLILYERSAQ